jgi:hypothetical protein
MNNLKLAIELCTAIYNISADRGIFPALAGGTLYKEGERKDIDILLCNLSGGDVKYDCLAATATFGHIIPSLILKKVCSGRVVKAVYKGVDIDFIYPEAAYDNTYQEGYDAEFNHPYEQ